MGASIRDFLASVKAWLASGVHRNSFLVLSRGRRGVSNDAMAGVHADSWLTNPTKERRSVLQAGVGNFDIASVMESSTLYPAAERMKPANTTLG